MSGLLAAAIGGFAGGVSDAWKDNRETAMQKAKEQMQMRLQDRADQRALNSEKMRFKNNMAVERFKQGNRKKDLILVQDSDGKYQYREKKIGGLLDGDKPIGSQPSKGNSQYLSSYKTRAKQILDEMKDAIEPEEKASLQQKLSALNNQFSPFIERIHMFNTGMAVLPEQPVNNTPNKKGHQYPEVVRKKDGREGGLLSQGGNATDDTKIAAAKARLDKKGIQEEKGLLDLRMPDGSTKNVFGVMAKEGGKAISDGLKKEREFVNKKDTEARDNFARKMISDFYSGEPSVYAAKVILNSAVSTPEQKKDAEAYLTVYNR